MRILKPSFGDDSKDSDWSLASANLILAFDYKLNDIINLQMEGLAVADIDTLSSGRLNAGKLIAEGPLRLRQPNLL
jgi:hypothetical protein